MDIIRTGIICIVKKKQAQNLMVNNNKMSKNSDSEAWSVGSETSIKRRNDIETDGYYTNGHRIRYHRAKRIKKKKMNTKIIV